MSEFKFVNLTNDSLFYDDPSSSLIELLFIFIMREPKLVNLAIDSPNLKDPSIPIEL